MANELFALFFCKRSGLGKRLAVSGLWCQWNVSQKTLENKKGSNMKLEYQSGFFRGKTKKEINLWKAYSTLKANGIQVIYEPPPHALQVRYQNLYLQIYRTGSISVVVKEKFSEKKIEKIVKKILKKTKEV